MKETHTNYLQKGEGNMKKTLIVVALATALVLAMGVSPAFAKYAGYSSSTQYVPWAEAQTLASLNADAALMASGPHAGYATTTIKCAVCHSVHRGGTDLLNEGAACAYCHTGAYYGGGAVASDLISWSGAGPHASRCTNTDCHGGPHGVGASTYAGPATRLLTRQGRRRARAESLPRTALPTSLPTSTLERHDPCARHRRPVLALRLPRSTRCSVSCPPARPQTIDRWRHRARPSPVTVSSPLRPRTGTPTARTSRAPRPV